MQLTQTQITIQAFSEAFRSGVAGIDLAAHILAALVDRDGPKVYERVMAAEPTADLDTLYRLELVGRDMIPLKLLFDRSPVARRIAALPAPVIKKACEKPVSVVEVQNGQKKTIAKPATDLTEAEAKRVFAGRKINTPEEQAKQIDREAARKVVAPEKRYEIKDNGDVVILVAPITFTAAQIETIAKLALSKSIQSLKK